jgi:Xaa-Pro aminopeptidase
MNEARHDEPKDAPFATAQLDSLLENEGIDVLVATSKHNVQYLLGGYRFFFFDYVDAIGVSRYLPVVVYQKGRPDNSAYIGCHLESHEKQLGKFWPRVAETTSRNSTSAIQRAVEHIRGLPGPIDKVGVEASFLPWDAAKVLQDGLDNCRSSTPISLCSGYARERRAQSLRSCVLPPNVFWLRCLPCSTGVRPAKRNMSSSTDCDARRSSEA